MRRISSSFFLWLMMLVLPIQGFAAVSMLYCGMRSDHQGARSETRLYSNHLMASADNGARQVMKSMVPMHDHSVDDVISSDEPRHAISADSQMSHASGIAPDDAHKCGVCASCCNLVGMTTPVQTVAIHSPPNAAYIEHSILIRSVPLVLPKKPPRA